LIKVKLGWISAAAYASTGYGIMTKEIVSRLIKKGYDVLCIGGIGGQTVWGGKLNYHTDIAEIPVVPTMGHLGGKDVANIYIRRYELDVIITFWDCFVVNYAGELLVPAIQMIPIDAPFTHKMYNDVKDAYKIIAYSKFGYNELLKWFPPSKIEYIPHGINTEVFKPQPEKETKRFREMFGIPEDSFLFVTLGANVGERKQLPLLLHAFKQFLKKHKDAYLFMYTNPNMAFPQGYDLLGIADALGIREHLKYPPIDPILDPWEQKDLAIIYSAADVYITPSLGEGFGVPILEAQSCGTPVIGTDCSAIHELVEGHSWLIKTVKEFVFYPVWIPTLQVYPVPDMEHMLMCMESAYKDRDLLETLGKKAREFALQYDWKYIMPKWYNFLDEVEYEINMFKTLIKELA